jgi:hypothetical protein
MFANRCVVVFFAPFFPLFLFLIVRLVAGSLVVVRLVVGSLMAVFN